MKLNFKKWLAYDCRSLSVSRIIISLKLAFKPQFHWIISELAIKGVQWVVGSIPSELGGFKGQTEKNILGDS